MDRPRGPRYCPTRPRCDSLWALARVEAAFTWRDPEIFGPFRAAQTIRLAIALTCFALFALRALYTGRTVREILASRARVGRPATVPIGAGGDEIGSRRRFRR